MRYGAFLFVFLGSVAGAASNGGRGEDSRELFFEPNYGQTDAAVRYLARAEGLTLYFGPQGVTAAGRTGAVRLRFESRKAGAGDLEGRDLLPGKSHYHRGGDMKPIRNVPHHGRLMWREVYPGISAVFYGNRQRVEMDLELAPGADPEQIRVTFEGAAASLEADGSVAAGPVRLAPPVAFQGQQEVQSAFTVRGDGIGFELGRYDTGKRLRIDRKSVV